MLVDPAGTPPAAGAELSTFVCYESPTATTAYRAASAQACPVSPTNGAIATWEHYDYDGLGRRIRERRLLPGAQVSKRFTLYDGSGRAYFDSEWVSDGDAETISRGLATACVFASSPAWPTARAASAPGTLRLCHDPFGRPQQVVGSKHSSLATFDRSDAGHPYSDVAERAKTYCVNAAFANLQQATCGAGGLKPETTTRRDGFGRIVQVTEPTGDVTSYAWDRRGRAGVGLAGRADEDLPARRLGPPALRDDARGRHGHDGRGRQRRQRAPGDARGHSPDAGLRLRRAPDPGERRRRRLRRAVLGRRAALRRREPGAPGGRLSGGEADPALRLQPHPDDRPVADEQFEYGGSGGRLSRLVTALGNGDLAASASQSWTYDSLGLAASHGHPRVTGSFPSRRRTPRLFPPR
jgi:hypothetical protein